MYQKIFQEPKVYVFSLIQDKHKCGCGNGLACKVTTTITLPFGIKIPIKQCVKAA